MKNSIDHNHKKYIKKNSKEFIPKNTLKRPTYIWRILTNDHQRRIQQLCQLVKIDEPYIKNTSLNSPERIPTWKKVKKVLNHEQETSPKRGATLQKVGASHGWKFAQNVIVKSDTVRQLSRPACSRGGFTLLIKTPSFCTMKMSVVVYGHAIKDNCGLKNNRDRFIYWNIVGYTIFDLLKMTLISFSYSEWFKWIRIYSIYLYVISEFFDKKSYNKIAKYYVISWEFFHWI